MIQIHPYHFGDALRKQNALENTHTHRHERKAGQTSITPKGTTIPPPPPDMM